MSAAKTMTADVVIIGGGPGGMSAAVSAKNAGAAEVVIIEREPRLSGILQQCIHNGFGLHKFKEELTGPEYGQRYEEMVSRLGITVMTETMAVDITPDRTVTAVSKERGYFSIKAGAVVLAMGCREKPRGALSIPGTRPAGVFTAGTAQKLVNIKGYMPGKDIVILGSGDIGLIMARRMTLEGARVKAVCEIMEDSGGLTRNIVQCLQDFNIPLLLRHTVVEIHGKKRVEGVTVAKVDGNLKPIPGTEEYIECDTLMLSVGLIPENELSKKAGVELDPKTRGPVVDENRQTKVSGIFACGNVVKVHELVDFVSDEGEIAGRSAALYAQGLPLTGSETSRAGGSSKPVPSTQKKGVKNLVSEDGKGSTVICTICPMGCKIQVEALTTEESHPEKPAQPAFRVTGNTCKRGERYAVQEVTAPQRTLTTTMYAKGGVIVPVKTDRPVPREKLSSCMKVINCKTLILPIEAGDIIIENIEDTGANVIAERSFL